MPRPMPNWAHSNSHLIADRLDIQRCLYLVSYSGVRVTLTPLKLTSSISLTDSHATSELHIANFTAITCYLMQLVVTSLLYGECHS